jgi:sugar lactone lactonase YvrE
MTEPAETTEAMGCAQRQAPASPWRERLELGEGARWVDGRLVLVDILSGRLLADGRTGRALETLAELDVPLGAVAPIQGAPSTWIAAAGTGVCILTEAGGISWVCHVAQSSPVAMRINDATADAAGRFWFGTMAYDATEDAGSLYRVDRDGTVTRVLDRITIPNGPAFTEDGTTMYLADSARGLVRRYRVDPVTGELGEPELFADFAHVPGGPDGMAVDREGAVWIACWGGGTVRRYLPDGTPDRVIELPAAQPAAVCLGGPDGRLLHVTTAAYGLNPPGAHDGAVFTVPVEVPGLPAAAFHAEAQVAALLEESRSAGRDVRSEAGR